MNTIEVGAWIRYLISINSVHSFYVCKEWVKLRREVLDEQKEECQRCKAKGYYTKATHVHHVQYLKKHPELALSKYYTYNGKEYRNLLALCHACHEEVHDHRRKTKKVELTKERWD